MEDGQVAWSAEWSQSGDSPARASAIRVDPTGESVAVAATSSAERPDGDIATVVYDAEDGRERWNRTLDGPAGRGDQARDVAFGPRGRTVLATGETSLDVDRGNATVAAYAVEGGTTRWTDTERGEGAGSEVPLALATDDRGIAYLLARSSDGGKMDAAILSYDVDTGEGLGEARFDPGAGASGDEHPAALALDPRGEHVGFVGNVGEGRESRPLAVLYEAGG